MPDKEAPRSNNLPKYHASALGKDVRRFIYQRVLEKDGEFGVSLDDLTEVLPGGAIKARTVEDELISMREELERSKPGFKLTIRGPKNENKKAFFEPVDPNLFAVRSVVRPEVKAALGRVLWTEIYGVDYGSNKVDYVRRNVDNVRDRINAVRRRAVNNLLVDAGSSTDMVVAALLSVPSVPLPVRMDGATYLVSPRIITNSPRIVARVSASAHRRKIQEPILVGGQVRLDRDSVCGQLAETCLTQWGIRADLAVVGTTGFDADPEEGGFSSDDVDEAAIKASFLERAKLGVVILDSLKVSQPVSPFRVFARLSRANVDLVVIDDGVEVGEEAAAAVDKFQNAAAQAGIATLTLNTGDGQEERHAR